MSVSAVADCALPYYRKRPFGISSLSHLRRDNYYYDQTGLLWRRVSRRFNPPSHRSLPSIQLPRVVRRHLWTSPASGEHDFGQRGAGGGQVLRGANARRVRTDARERAAGIKIE
jgi:hypothetical protein